MELVTKQLSRLALAHCSILAFPNENPRSKGMFLHTFKALDQTMNFEVNQEERATTNIMVNISEAMASGGTRIKDGKFVNSPRTMNALRADAKCALITSNSILGPHSFLLTFVLVKCSLHYHLKPIQ